jgi:anti-sigma regulatory factor (Ser/Thr protein kinase)
VLDRDYAGTTSTLRAARNDVLDWLKENLLGEDLQDRAALVLSELTSNAVQASPGHAYKVHASLDDEGAVVIAVTSRSDHGLPPPREQWGPATVLAARGRGLLIVGKLSDQVVVAQPEDNIVVVTSTLRRGTQV